MTAREKVQNLTKSGTELAGRLWNITTYAPNNRSESADETYGELCAVFGEIEHALLETIEAAAQIADIANSNIAAEIRKMKA